MAAFLGCTQQKVLNDRQTRPPPFSSSEEENGTKPPLEGPSFSETPVSALNSSNACRAHSTPTTTWPFPAKYGMSTDFPQRGYKMRAPDGCAESHSDSYFRIWPFTFAA